jgi:hypothetical protein
MTTKQEMLEIIKAENPNGLRVGNDEEGYTQLSQAETDAILNSWADARLAKQKAIAEAEAKAAAKSAAEAKLAALGLTTDDLKALGLN